jgi:phospho-N-acetylmuramoyl-pentapeptide-transferase
MIISLTKVFLPAIISFLIGVLITPAITGYLYRNKMWKKKAGKKALDGSDAKVFNELHKEKEVGTPRMGGMVIWLSATATILLVWVISKIFPTDTTLKLDFLSRSQTWLPLFTLLGGALVGAIDDSAEIRGSIGYIAGGLSLKKRLLAVTVISGFVAYWFFAKLGVSSIGLPLGMALNIGWLFIPFFIIVALAVYSGGTIDGIDGLAGGVFASMFAAYAGIAFFQNQVDLAAFCAVILGGILAFLWFNIPPARFYMSETGSMALTITLTVVAFMTDKLGDGYGVLVLPIIALPLFVTSASSIIQVLSKKYRHGKKIFLVAPLHHHFEALGWPSYKVTMRYWIISLILALIGIIVGLLG